MALDARQRPGVFVAVVGPSGAGKDSLLGYAREHLGDDPQFVFVRRIVTRAADAALEDHDSWTADDFETGLRNGQFALAWKAHNLGYGLPAEIAADIDAGRVVIANISRQSIDAARSAFGSCRVVSVTAPKAVIAARLAARGRESAADVEARLSRALEPIAGPDVIEIENAGALAVAGDHLVHLLRGLAGAPPA